MIPKYVHRILGAPEVLGDLAENLSKTGWIGVGAVSQDLIRTGKRSGIVDAHRDDGRRFIVNADESSAPLLNLNVRC